MVVTKLLTATGISLLASSYALTYFFKFESEYSVFYLPLFLATSGIVIISFVVFSLISKFQKTNLSSQDIKNELKENKQKYTSILENIHIGFARTTPGSEGEFKEINSFFAKMMGYEKSELLKMPVADIYIDKAQRKKFSNKIIEKDTIKNEELLFSHKNGSPITVSVTGRAIRGENETVRFFDLIIEDVTKEKFNNQELIKNEKLASIGTLAGGIAHDFNNILTGLYGNIALAKLDLSPDHESFKLIQDAELSMSMATDLTQQLLIFARGGDPVKKTLTIDQLVKDTAKFNLAGSEIKLVSRFDENLWKVNADKGQIRQVVSNMVSNSKDAMPKGGILTLTIQNIELIKGQIPSLVPGKYVKIILQDSGIGIKKDTFSKIFDPYFSTKHGGTGLGLATSYSIIRKHHGLITAEHEIENGAVFNIYLPAKQEPLTDSTSIKDQDKIEVKSAKILIMDDDEQVCSISKKMIERFGFHPFVVHDGIDAILEYESHMNSDEPFDLILMDLTIPGGMGGKDAIGKILEIDPDAKAIVVSGYSNDPVLANHTDYGFKGMLVKPFRIEELKQILDRTLI